jgi:hypothetical protein
MARINGASPPACWVWSYCPTPPSSVRHRSAVTPHAGALGTHCVHAEQLLTPRSVAVARSNMPRNKMLREEGGGRRLPVPRRQQARCGSASSGVSHGAPCYTRRRPAPNDRSRGQVPTTPGSTRSARHEGRRLVRRGGAAGSHRTAARRRFFSLVLWISLGVLTLVHGVVLPLHFSRPSLQGRGIVLADDVPRRGEGDNRKPPTSPCRYQSFCSHPCEA